MIEARNLTAGYAKRDIVAVDTLTIRSSEVTALIGPNAAGKSTLIRCLAGLLRPKTGNVEISGRDVHRTRAKEMSNLLAFAGQENVEAFAFTVRELVAIGAAANAAAAEPASVRIDRAMESMDLQSLAGRDLLRLSGGERQRAAIARALAQATPYLMLDEPTAHLDLKYQAALMNACCSAARDQGMAVLIVLHDLNLAAAFADRLILLGAGRIVADGTPAEILNSQQIENVYQTTVRRSGQSNGDAPWIHIMPSTALPAHENPIDSEFVDAGPE